MDAGAIDLINRTNSGMNYWGISNLNLAELQPLVQLENDSAALRFRAGISSRAGDRPRVSYK